ncbi:MAG: beta-1,4-N-acetylglucosaminyltransferase, partial [Parvicella sp.]
MKRKLKICVLSSAGGHFTEVSQLESFYKKYDHFYFVEKSFETIDLVKKGRVYFLKLLNRKMFFLIPFILINFFISLYVFYKERPSLLITTGVLSAIPMCVIGKIFGCKIIFIESFCRINSQTMAGKFLYSFSDLFIIQNKRLQKYYPNAVYGG